MQDKRRKAQFGVSIVIAVVVAMAEQQPCLHMASMPIGVCGTVVGYRDGAGLINSKSPLHGGNELSMAPNRMGDPTDQDGLHSKHNMRLSLAM